LSNNCRKELEDGRQQRYDCTVDILTKIKRLAIARRLRFTFKADIERIHDGLSVEDIVESLVNAPVINKTLRSRSPNRLLPREKLYVIISSTYDGTLIYAKETIRRTQGVEEYYLLISAKKDAV
jgi:hypothetical protein